VAWTLPRWPLARAAIATSWLGGLVGCGDAVDFECRQAPSQRSQVVRGITSAEYVYLSPEQERALVGLQFQSSGAWCSGTLIATRALVTAGHCLDSIEDGSETAPPDVEVELVSKDGASGPVGAHVARHPELDVALLIFDEPPLNDVSPILLADGKLRVGDLLQVGGYGYDEEGQVGNLRFAVEAISELEPSTLTVSSDGASGLCDGDSGSAALSRGQDGAVFVTGILNSGTVTCRGSDLYVRSAAFESWARETLETSSVATATESPAETVACGRLQSTGRCFGETAVFCEGDSLRGEVCGDGLRCGWDPKQRGFRCVEPATDPCRGQSELGQCVEAHSVSCDHGHVSDVPCDVCEATCFRDARTGRTRCATQ
jgi:hypothetical protein